MPIVLKKAEAGVGPAASHPRALSNRKPPPGTRRDEGRSIHVVKTRPATANGQSAKSLPPEKRAQAVTPATTAR